MRLQQRRTRAGNWPPCTVNAPWAREQAHTAVAWVREYLPSEHPRSPQRHACHYYSTHGSVAHPPYIRG